MLAGELCFSRIAKVLGISSCRVAQLFATLSRKLARRAVSQKRLPGLVARPQRRPDIRQIRAPLDSQDGTYAWVAVTQVGGRYGFGALVASRSSGISGQAAWAIDVEDAALAYAVGIFQLLGRLPQGFPLTLSLAAGYVACWMLEEQTTYDRPLGEPQELADAKAAARARLRRFPAVDVRVLSAWTGDDKHAAARRLANQALEGHVLDLQRGTGEP